MEITTDDIRKFMTEDKAIPLGSTTRVEYGNTAMDTSTLSVQLTPSDAQTIGKAILDGLMNFSPNREDTLAERTVGLPTLVARLDCTLRLNNMVASYEVEERPNGLGVFHAVAEQKSYMDISTTLDNHYRTLVGSPPTVLVSPERGFNDDQIVFDTTMLRAEDCYEKPVLLRAEPSEITAAHNKSQIIQSVSTVRTEGDKMYRVATGDAAAINDVKMLPESESFVLKSKQGSKSRGVTVYLNPSDKKRFHGGNMATKSQVIRNATVLIERDGCALVEQLIDPMVANMEGCLGQAILRVFGLISETDVSIIGGLMVSTRGMKVHGTPESITSLVTVEDIVPVPRSDIR